MVTATPKQAETVSERSTSSIGPAATKRPARSRAACVIPAGISSAWCVTSTIGGVHGSAASEARLASRRSRAPMSRPGRRLVEQEELRPAHERAGEQHVLALALGDDAELPVADAALPAHPGVGEQPVGLAQSASS